MPRLCPSSVKSDLGISYRKPSFYIPNMSLTVLRGCLMPHLDSTLSGTPAMNGKSPCLGLSACPHLLHARGLSGRQANTGFSTQPDLGKANPAQRREACGRVGGRMGHKPRNVSAKLLGAPYLNHSLCSCLLPTNYKLVYFQLKMPFVLLLLYLYLNLHSVCEPASRWSDGALIRAPFEVDDL